MPTLISNWFARQQAATQSYCYRSRDGQRAKLRTETAQTIDAIPFARTCCEFPHRDHSRLILSDRSVTSPSARAATATAFLSVSTALATVLQSLTTFGLTKLIGVGEFGAWREFVLFAGLTGVLHAGFADGLQVSWCRTREGPLVPDVRWAFKVISIAHVGWLGIAVGVSLAFPSLEAFPFFVDCCRPLRPSLECLHRASVPCPVY